MEALRVAIGFAPWFAFALLANRPEYPNMVAVAALVAALIALGAVTYSRIRRLSAKILDLTAVVGFSLVAVVGFVGDGGVDRFLADYGQPIVSAALAIVIVALLPVVPFTEQYAKEQVPEEFWGYDEFKQVNRRISLAWAAAIGGMAVAQAAATFLQHADLDESGTWDVILNWVVPIVLLVKVIQYTKVQSERPDDTDGSEPLTRLRAGR